MSSASSDPRRQMPHANVSAPRKPRPAQMSELHRQIGSKRITDESIQDLIRNARLQVAFPVNQQGSNPAEFLELLTKIEAKAEELYPAYHGQVMEFLMPFCGPLNLDVIRIQKEEEDALVQRIKEALFWTNVNALSMLEVNNCEALRKCNYKKSGENLSNVVYSGEKVLPEIVAAHKTIDPECRERASNLFHDRSPGLTEHLHRQYWDSCGGRYGLFHPGDIEVLSSILSGLLQLSVMFIGAGNPAAAKKLEPLLKLQLGGTPVLHVDNDGMVYVMCAPRKLR